MSAPVSLSSNDIDSIIDEVLAMPDNRDFAGVILFADHETGVEHHRTVGLADESWENEHTLDTKFLVGSNTKCFTAALVMKLIEEGAESEKTGKPLGLSGVVSDYLDYYRKDNADRITIHQLLSMRAGLPDYTASGPSFFGTFNRWAFKTRDFVEMFCSADVLFEPGEGYQYSNSNYYILGAVIEEVTGRPFGEVLKEKILDPLEMNDTGVFDPTAMYSRMAVGYNKMKNTRRHFTDMSVPFSAGAMYSTAPDFLKWDEALYTEKALSRATLEKMTTPYSFYKDFYSKYGCMYFGYGMLIQYIERDPRKLPYEGCPDPGASFPPDWIRLISFMGILPDGFVSAIIRNPEARQAVIVMSNHYSEQSDSFIVANEITKRLVRSQ